MPTTVSYNGQKLVPAPLLNINKSYVYTGSEEIGTTYNITVNGYILANMGSPSSSGLWDSTGYPPDETPTGDQHLGYIIRKQERLRDLFADNYKSFEVQSADGSQPIKFNPKVLSISFAEDTWYNLCRYTIELEAPALTVFGQSSEDIYPIGSGQVYLESAEETWSMEYVEETNIFNLSHTLSAQGKNYFDPDSQVTITAFDSAKLWVQNRFGIDLTVANSNSWGNSYTASDVYNYIRTEQTNRFGGSYGVGETWVLSNRPYTEQYNVSLTAGLEGPSQVTIDGTVTGLAVRTPNESGLYLTTSKFTNASGAFYNNIVDNLYTRALNTCRLSWINPYPLSYTIGSNVNEGLITYNFSYDTRPTNTIFGSRTEDISIQDSYPADVVAVIPVLGRRAGPIIQNINTVTERSRSLTINVNMQPPSGNYSKLDYINFRPDYSGIINLVRPAGTVYVQSDTETWDPANLRGSRSIGWIWT